MGTFEKILLDYGGYILICVRNVFQVNEKYERCAEINKVLQQYNISTSMTQEDWQVEMWRTGTSGEVAIKNAPFIFLKQCSSAKTLACLINA